MPPVGAPPDVLHANTNSVSCSVGVLFQITNMLVSIIKENLSSFVLFLLLFLLLALLHTGHSEVKTTTTTWSEREEGI